MVGPSETDPESQSEPQEASLPLTQQASAQAIRREITALSIIVPVALGVALYLVLDGFGQLASLTFILAVPTALTLLGLILKDNDDLRSYRAMIVRPVIIMVTLFVLLLSLGLESLICLIVLAAPFILVGLLVAFMVRLVARRRALSHGTHLSRTESLRRTRRDRLRMAILLPSALIACDYMIGRPHEMRHVERSVIVMSRPSVVFANVTTVRPIAAGEREPGFWQLVGIPAPIEATLDHQGVGGVRIGRFERGLRFVERIIRWEQNRFVEFTVNVDSTSLGDPMLDHHVLAGSYFAFGTVSYHIDSLDEHRVRLTLACSYHLRSSINRYSALWGDAVISDFEEQLLAVIARRCERTRR